MGAVEEKGAVPKIKGYSGINPCWSERKDSQVKPSDLDGYVHDSEEAHTALGGFQTWGTNWMHRTPDYPTHPAAQANLGWFVIITWKFAVLLHICEECCKHLVLEAMNLPHVCTEMQQESAWLNLCCLILPFLQNWGKKIALNRNTLSEFGSRSQRKQLTSSREQKPTSEKQRKKQPQTPKNRKSSRKFPYRDLICYCTQILALGVKIDKKLSSLIHHLLPTVL